jgi:tetratricopeptide (TPR) repeat protein
MNESSDETDKIDTLLSQTQAKIREGLFTEAEEYLEQALEINFEHPRILSALKCCKFWKERIERLNTIHRDYDRANFLLESWGKFLDFSSRLNDPLEMELHALRQWVFGTALVNYKRVLREGDSQDPDILLQLGRCCKGMGEYENALEYLETVGQRSKEDPAVLAELGDCYALVNETKAAKAFFREAFFIGPQKVTLTFLESGLIVKLIERLKDMGYAGRELAEWMPVYGVVFGVFNVKRELRPLEYGKLKQSIYSLEKRIDEEHSAAEDDYSVPRLLNRYFWLIDHFVISKENRERIEEIIQKIKVLDANIYDQYIN